MSMVEQPVDQFRDARGTLEYATGYADGIYRRPSQSTGAPDGLYELGYSAGSRAFIVRSPYSGLFELNGI